MRLTASIYVPFVAVRGTHPFVGNIYDAILFLPDKSRFVFYPEIRHCQKCFGIVVARNVVYFENRNQFALFARFDNRSKAFDGILFVLGTRTAHHAHAICARFLYAVKGHFVVLCKPLMRKVYSAHDKFVTICVIKFVFLNVKPIRAANKVVTVQRVTTRKRDN